MSQHSKSSQPASGQEAQDGPNIEESNTTQQEDQDGLTAQGSIRLQEARGGPTSHLDTYDIHQQEAQGGSISQLDVDDTYLQEARGGPTSHLDTDDKQEAHEGAEAHLDGIQSRERRCIRTLTKSGQDHYEDLVNKYSTKLSRVQKDINAMIDIYYETGNDTKTVRSCKENLMTLRDKYSSLSKDFITFLTRQNTKESMSERRSHMLVASEFDKDISDALKKMEFYFIIHDIPEIDNVAARRDNVSHVSMHSGTHRSKRSRHSRGSSSASSSILMRTKAKAVAAKAKAKFIEQEVALKVEQARLQGEMDILGAHKDEYVAEAEFKAMENFCDEYVYGSDRSISEVDPSDKLDDVRSYVKSVEEAMSDGAVSRNYCGDRDIRTDKQPIPDSGDSKGNTTIKRDNRKILPKTDGVRKSGTTLNPKAPDFVPQPQMNDLANFIVKKDLLRTRITSFDDSPQTYPSWKTTFQSVVKELSVNSAQELDLLVRWLGPESKEYAKSIRAANADNPVHGCELLWDRLNERYGAPERVEETLQKKLRDFPRIGNNPKLLYALNDVLNEIASLKRNEKYDSLLSYFDSSVGVKPIVQKLPAALQHKWSSKASKYKQTHNVLFPPFSVFCQFVKETASMMNDPALAVQQEGFRPRGRQDAQHARKVDVKKTDIQPNSDSPQNGTFKCPIHHAPHSLNQCRAFRRKPLRARKQSLAENKLCFRCCESNSHVFATCTASIKCQDCGSTAHTTAMHRNIPAKGAQQSERTEENVEQHGGEKVIDNKCTCLCGDKFVGRSCAKIVLVTVYHKDNPENRMRLYAIIDDQSTATLGKSDLFDFMGVPTSTTESFKLRTCAGHLPTSGRRAAGLVVVSADGSEERNLPDVTECDDIPNERSEIPTPDIIRQYDHLKDVPILPLDPDVDILLLIGRDMIDAHIVQEQILGPQETPFAQKLCLGWTVVGEVCEGKFHKPSVIDVRKTCVLKDGRSSLLLPCTNSFGVKEVFRSSYPQLGEEVFAKFDDDDKTGLSIEDRQFVEIMQGSFVKDDDGRWKVPLPFKSPRHRLPNNRTLALKRAHVLDASLRKNPRKREHMVTFMRGLIDSGDMEEAPSLSSDTECWYLPLFGIYHPRKPDKIRGVFDSSVLCVRVKRLQNFVNVYTECNKRNATV